MGRRGRERALRRSWVARLQGSCSVRVAQPRRALCDARDSAQGKREDGPDQDAHPGILVRFPTLCYRLHARCPLLCSRNRTEVARVGHDPVANLLMLTHHDSSNLWGASP